LSENRTPGAGVGMWTKYAYRSAVMSIVAVPSPVSMTFTSSVAGQERDVLDLREEEAVRWEETVGALDPGDLVGAELADVLHAITELRGATLARTSTCSPSASSTLPSVTRARTSQLVAVLFDNHSSSRLASRRKLASTGENARFAK
jgi:hypothetical protein